MDYCLGSGKNELLFTIVYCLCDHVYWWGFLYKLKTVLDFWHFVEFLKKSLFKLR